MGLGDQTLGQYGWGMDGPVPQIGCNPLLKGSPNGTLWALGIDDDGELTLTQVSFTVNHHAGPILGELGNTWQLSMDDSEPGNEFMVVTRVNPPTILGPLTYIPLLSPIGGAWKLVIADTDGTLQTVSTSLLLPDILPRQPDVTMSIYGNAPPLIPLICNTCGNASVTASADLSLWCCTCSSYIFPEDSNVVVVLDE
jgi:hypothetical protein